MRSYALRRVGWWVGGGVRLIVYSGRGFINCDRHGKKAPPTRCDKNVSKRTSSVTFPQYFLALPSDSVFGVRRLCQKVLWKEGRRISNTPWAEGRRISNTLWAEGRRKLLLASFIRFLQMTQYGRNNALKRVAITR